MAETQRPWTEVEPQTFQLTYTLDRNQSIEVLVHIINQGGTNMNEPLNTMDVFIIKRQGLLAKVEPITMNWTVTEKNVIMNHYYEPLW